jgi:hypothetical protein
MRCLNRVLLRASLGVLMLTPCAYGSPIRTNYSVVRGEYTTHHTLGNQFWFSGKSVFHHTEPRAIRGSVHIVPEHLSLSHHGHGTGVSTSDHSGSNPGSGGNWGNGSNPGPSGNWGNGSNPGPGGNWNDGSNPGPDGQGGYTSVPEGGTTASYLVPAGFVAFGGIFLAGFRRQGATF